MWPEPWDEPPTRGIPDRQQIPPLCHCAQCGGEIYPGGAGYTDTPAAPGTPGSVNLHKDCLADWIQELGAAALAEAFGFHSIGGDS